MSFLLKFDLKFVCFLNKHAEHLLQTLDFLLKRLRSKKYWFAASGEHSMCKSKFLVRAIVVLWKSLESELWKKFGQTIQNQVFR